MGIDKLMGNEGAKRLIKNQLNIKKESGTYLFYGRSGIDLDGYALAFAKAVNCQSVEDDFCGECRSCVEIDKGIYPDLTIIESENNIIGVDKIRDVIYKAGSSGYSGLKKIFIIKEISKMRKEAANAILKTIEEPPKGTFFILTSHTLNILPTIKSRSMLINIYPPSIKESGIDEKIYTLLEGNIDGITYIKDRSLENIINDEEADFIRLFIEYSQDYTIENRIKLYYFVELFLDKVKFLSDKERIKIASDIEKAASGNKELLKELMQIIIIKMSHKNFEFNLEEFLEIREAVHYGVNLQSILTYFFMKVK